MENFKMLFGNGRHKAFTLAEVLITLGIIGVVAALTMPSLMANYRKLQTVTQLKKSVATLQNGFREIMAEKECDNWACTDLYGADNDAANERIRTAMKKKFKIMKYCANDVSCHNAPINQRDGQGSQYTLLLLGDHNFILPDGVSVAFETSSAHREAECTEGAFCGYVIIDINGVKPPNILGDDVFMYFLGYKGYLYANGSDVSNQVLERNIDPEVDCLSTGDSCSEKILVDGWDITYW